MATTNPTTGWNIDDYNAGKLKTDNFKWGTAGQGQEGVDWGNTNNWGAQQWVDWNNQYNAKPSGETPTQGTSGTPTQNSSYPAAPGEQDVKGQLVNQLLQRMQQSITPDANNPVMKQQMDAYNAQQDRATRQMMDTNAEQAAARGLGNSGALNVENRMANEQAGLNSANFQGQLMQNELNARREEVQNALEQMGNILSEDQKNALTKEMHDIDAAIERTKVENQNSQYYAGLSSQERMLANRLAQEWALGQQGNEIDWARLAQGDNQWADQMGFNTADRQAYWDSVRRGQ